MTETTICSVCGSRVRTDHRLGTDTCHACHVGQTREWASVVGSKRVIGSRMGRGDAFESNIDEERYRADGGNGDGDIDYTMRADYIKSPRADS